MPGMSGAGEVADKWGAMVYIQVTGEDKSGDKAVYQGGEVLMDVKEKLSNEEKQAFENLRIESLVLQKLAGEKGMQAQGLFKQVMERLGYNPAMYGLEFNFVQDSWQIKLRPDAIVVPGVMPKNLREN